jgi:hypothetical protein
MFGGRTTPWEQKTKGDIIATMIAFRGDIYELRKRRKDTTQNQEHRPPT